MPPGKELFLTSCWGKAKDQFTFFNAFRMSELLCKLRSCVLGVELIKISDYWGQMIPWRYLA